MRSQYVSLVATTLVYLSSEIIQLPAFNGPNERASPSLAFARFSPLHFYIVLTHNIIDLLYRLGCLHSLFPVQKELIIKLHTEVAKKL